MPSLTPMQIKTARTLLDWHQVDLAERTGLSKVTISLIERRRCSPRVDTMAKIEAAFEEAGIEFQADGAIRLSNS